MKKADLDAYRERLLAMRGRLRGDVSALANVALNGAKEEGSGGSNMPIHMAELGSENFEQEFALSLVATEEDTLASIDAALARIQQGAFGLCVECGAPIPKTRLNAIPHTPLCVRCAEKLEGV